MAVKVSDMRTYIKNDMNILLSGKHGSGKTAILRQACEMEGMKMKFFNAATMDPYLELIGIPNPHAESNSFTMMSPNNGITDAEVIMIDEPNRAPDMSVMNALFELVQFRSVNGIKLPNLKCVVSAMNPAGDSNYQVMEMDAAFIDRFDLVIQSDPSPSKLYFSSVFGKKIADALIEWHESLPQDDDHYVSSRRLEIIGNVWTKIHTMAALESAMPPKGRFNTGMLYSKLVSAEKAERDVTKEKTSGIDVTASSYAVLNMAKNNHTWGPINRAISEIGRDKFLGVFKTMNDSDQMTILLAMTSGINAKRFVSLNKDILAMSASSDKNSSKAHRTLGEQLAMVMRENHGQTMKRKSYDILNEMRSV